MKKIYFGLFQTLGDIIVSTAIIRAIKVKYPDSHIVYAVGKDYTDVLKNNPDINEIIPCSSPQEIVLRAGAGNYDKIFLPLMLVAEDTLWHQRPPWCVPGENKNLVDMYAAKCGDDLKITDRRTFVYPTDKEWNELVEQIPESNREKFQQRPFITIHTSSRLESKDWPEASFAELALRLYAHFEGKFEVYQIGGPTDKPLPRPVIGLMGTPFLHTAAIIKRSLFHIDIDSGPSFIADSLDVPTLCIMGSTTKDIAGPIGPNTTFVEPDSRKCIGTATHCACVTHCLIKEDCIKTISVDRVFKEAVRILEPIVAKLDSGQQL